MKCPKCQFENPEAAKFCNECGYKFSQPSGSIPKDLSVDEKIQKIQKYLPKGLTDKILSQKDKIEGERKQVTVMFADMEGFTPLVEKLGSEEAYSIMDQVYEILIHKVHDYEGTINEMPGDGIMALFGAPIALEDAPLRAIRSAHAIHREMDKFSNRIKQEKEGALSLKMRIGIHTGPVVVGTLGNDLRVEFKAVGDTVNLASRMEGLAEPGTIAVTEETYKRTNLYFNFESLGEKEVKGKEKPVSVYKVISEKEKIHRRLISDRLIQSEMVGRETEMDTLELAVAKAKNGEGSIVNIIGEAGIGKSRLIAELKNSDIVKRTTILEGRALSMGRNLSFYPIIEILKGFAGIGEDDSPTEQLYKLEKAVKNIHPEYADEIIPFVGTLMGMQLAEKYAERVEGIEGEVLEQLIYKNLRDFILKSAELSPLIFIMEDLHWADTSSIDLIISLCRLVKNNRILIIHIFRPHYDETGEKLRKSLEEEYPGLVTEIGLHSLNSDQSDQLIDNLLKIEGLPADMRDQIKERSEGNPFFIEEMARSMIDEDAIEFKEGKFHVTRKIESVVVPNTIQELLMSRIDRLDEKTKSLLRTASVIGRHFFRKILSEVMESVEDIDDKLVYLQEIQLIREGKRMEEVEYLFKHALAQETTYGSILQERRKGLHLKVAESFERVFADRLSEFYGMLAYHYNRAGDLNKTEEYMLKAGEEALKSSASSEALDYFQKTIELYIQRYGNQVDRIKLANLETNLANAYYYKGYNSQSVVYFDRALQNFGFNIHKSKFVSWLELAWNLVSLLRHLYLPSIRTKRAPSDQDNRIMRLLLNRGYALSLADVQKSTMNAMIISRISIKADISDSPLYIEALSSVGGAFAYSGLSYRLSHKILHYVDSTLKKREKSFSLWFVEVIKMYVSFFSVNWSNIDFDAEILNDALKAGEIWNSLNYLFFFGTTHMELGNFDKVEMVLDKKKALTQQFYDETNTHYQNLNICLAIKKRETDDSLANVEEALKILDRTGEKTIKIRFIGFKICIEALQLKLETARRTIDEGASLIDEFNIIPPYFTHVYMLGKLLFYIACIENSQSSIDESEWSLKPGDRKDLFSLIRKIIKTSKKHGFFKIEAFRLVGISYWLFDNQNKALKWFDKSIKEGERLGARPDLSRTYFEVGKRLLEPKSKYKHLNGITPEEYLEKARVLFEEMDLRWDLKQLEKIASNS